METNEKWIEMIWKEAVVAWLWQYPDIFLEGLRKIAKNSVNGAGLQAI
jgi:hypothetical protein